MSRRCRAGSSLSSPPSSRRKVAASSSSLSSSRPSFPSRPSSLRLVLLPLSERILEGLKSESDEKTRAWFTNYVNGSSWIGCKSPVVKRVVREQVLALGTEATTTTTTSRRRGASYGIGHSNDGCLPAPVLLDTAIELLRSEYCDAKLAGMELLGPRYLPIGELATSGNLDRFEKEVLEPGRYVADWSTADWFATKILRPIVFYDGGVVRATNPFVQRVLDYTGKPNSNLWYRRCGVVPFAAYCEKKHNALLPPDFVPRLLQACERSLRTSPEERFTQTGVAWVLRYVLAGMQEKNEDEDDDDDGVMDMIVRRNGHLWTAEAKRSLVEKLPQNDEKRKRILNL